MRTNTDANQSQAVRGSQVTSFRSTLMTGMLLVALSGCHSDPVGLESSDADALTTTDFAEYLPPPSATDPIIVRAVFSNRTGATVWVIRCSGPVPNLERLVGTEWERVGGGPELSCLRTTSIDPGAQLRIDYQIRTRDLSAEMVPGKFRLVWDEAVWNFEKRTETSAFGDRLPLRYRVSNRFEIRDR